MDPESQDYIIISYCTKINLKHIKIPQLTAAKLCIGMPIFVLLLFSFSNNYNHSIGK